MSCSEAATETAGNAAEDRLTAGSGGTYTCACVEGGGDCAGSFRVSLGSGGSARGHVSFTLYDRWGHKAASLSAKAVSGEQYYLHLLITDGSPGEIFKDGQNLQFRVDPDQFAQGQVEIALSGLIDANVSSFTLGGTCYESNVSGAGMYRVVIPFSVQGGGNAAC